MTFISIDTEQTEQPFYRQIYDSLRRSILNGELAPNQRLPASRRLAEELGVSRMTVINAYDQLLAEGYLQGKTGSGTYVAEILPEEYLRSPISGAGTKRKPKQTRTIELSPYGERVKRNVPRVLRHHSATAPVPFQHSIPAINEFPFEIWGKIANRNLKYRSKVFGGYGDAAGYLPLRQAIAQHLRSSRGVRCETEQVIITSGTQQAVSLISCVLLSTGDRVWFEDPGHLGARDIFEAGGMNIVPVPIDAEGMDLENTRRSSGSPRLVYVTPSHQFPLGVTMSLRRRLGLLEWANEADAWIVEDDYDSEFRYSGRPLPSLQGLDRHSRVLYVGTFSKTVFPALRLGCIVVPDGLVDVFSAARALNDLHGPVADQMILAEFISEGHFERHVRRMRTLYRERQAILIEVLAHHLGGSLELSQTHAGMHIIGWLPKGVSDQKVSERASEQGLRAAPLSKYTLRPSDRGGLLLGYTAFNDKQIRDAAKRLEKILTNR